MVITFLSSAMHRFALTLFIVLAICSCQELQKPMRDTELLPEKEVEEIVVDEVDEHFLAIDERLHFIGRVYNTKHESVLYSYPGIQLELAFEGTGLELQIKDHADKNSTKVNYLEIVLDEKVHHTLKLKHGKHWYKIIDGLPKGDYKLQIVKRTESMVGMVEVFNGKVLKGALKTYYRRDKRKIEFIGNSITCAYGVMAAIPEPPAGNPSVPFRAENENAYMSYAAMTARYLDADYSMVAYSGRGVYRNYDASLAHTMPKVYSYVMPHDYRKKWDFNLFIPDLVVINLGTNDYAKDPRRKLSDKKVSRAFTKLINRVHDKYPGVPVILCLSPMVKDGYPYKTKHRKRLRSVLEGVSKTFNKVEKLVFVHEFEVMSAPYGENWHPSMHTHEKMSKSLINFIIDNLNW